MTEHNAPACTQNNCCKKSCPKAMVLAVTILAIGIIGAGCVIGNGIYQSFGHNSTVSVRGVAERQVDADFAVWPIRYTNTGNVLSDVQKKLNDDTAIIRTFLSQYNIEPSEIEIQVLEVKDLLAQEYRSGPVDSRFILNQTLLVRTQKIKDIATAAQNVGALVDKGVIISNDAYTAGPSYIFTKLNDIKPEMIAQSTAAAKEAADQFARDSGASVGKIKNASQGLFEILPYGNVSGMMEEKNIKKNVRVVTSIQYYLD
jgi:hypothetical protein